MVKFSSVAQSDIELGETDEVLEHFRTLQAGQSLIWIKIFQDETEDSLRRRSKGQKEMEEEMKKAKKRWKIKLRLSLN